MNKAAENIIVEFAIVIVLAGIAIAADTGKERASLAAAEKWIALIDAGNYADSWEEGAADFKTAVNKEQWQTLLQDGHPSLGKVMSRKLQALYHSSLPGQPDSELAVVRFETIFANTKSVDEIVTLIQDGGSQWRVTGYVITSGMNYLAGLMALLLLIVIIAAWYMEVKPELRFFKKGS